MYLNTLC